MVSQITSEHLNSATVTATLFLATCRRGAGTRRYRSEQGLRCWAANWPQFFNNIPQQRLLNRAAPEASASRTSCLCSRGRKVFKRSLPNGGQAYQAHLASLQLRASDIRHIGCTRPICR